MLLSFSKVLASDVEIIDDDRTPGALKVLFIGNSYTFANDMPRMFSHMMHLGNANKSLKIHMVAFPSYTLAEHLQDPRTLQALEHDGPWDYVVLQERSFFPITRPGDMEQACQGLDKKIRSAGARTVIMETWADQDNPGVQSVINTTCRNIARRLNATVIQAGEAWPSALGTGQLYASDGHHPSAAGSFLVACATYKAIVGKDPKSLPTELESSLGIASGVARQIKDSVSNASESSVRTAGVPAASHAGGSFSPAATRANNGLRRPGFSSAPSAPNGVQTYNWGRK
jgi:hypothetical protein